MGRLVKIDVCTSTTLRGRYSRICVEVPIGTPGKKYINIGTLKQEIVYEGEGILCIECGCVGHTQLICSLRIGKVKFKEEKTEALEVEKSPSQPQSHNDNNKHDILADADAPW